MKIFLITILLFPLVAPGVAGARPAHGYLKPKLKVGEHLTTVFSKAVSISGQGFESYVRRVSGTADYVVEKVASDGVVFNETWRVDGNSSGSAKIKLLKDDMTYCRKGHCRIDRETSGLVFNPLLWGDPPANLHAGVTWAATISRPWEIGPPGVEHVRVLRADPVNHQLTLVREGSGDGNSLDDQRLKTITITTSTGKSIKVSVIPSKTHWSGYTTICNGIIVGDEIMVERDVTLVTQSGTRFHGKQRAYTLLNLASDIMPNKHHG